MCRSICKFPQFSIYWVYQKIDGKTRPHVVINNEIFNAVSGSLILAPLTHTVKDDSNCNGKYAEMRVHITGLDNSPCDIKMDQMYIISDRSKDIRNFAGVLIDMRAREEIVRSFNSFVNACDPCNMFQSNNNNNVREENEEKTIEQLEITSSNNNDNNSVEEKADESAKIITRNQLIDMCLHQEIDENKAVSTWSRVSTIGLMDTEELLNFAVYVKRTPAKDYCKKLNASMSNVYGKTKLVITELRRREAISIAAEEAYRMPYLSMQKAEIKNKNLTRSIG